MVAMIQRCGAKLKDSKFRRRNWRKVLENELFHAKLYLKHLPIVS